MTFSVVSPVSQVQLQYAKLLIEFMWYTASLETQTPSHACLCLEQVSAVFLNLSTLIVFRTGTKQ